MMPSVMVTARQILKLADEIAKNFSPQKIILFGSYAYGKPNEDSDVDLMVVMNYRGSNFSAACRIDTHHQFPLDLLVRSPKEIQYRLSIEDWFMWDVIEKGIVLYDATDGRVREKGRSRLRRRLHSKAIEKSQSA
jgi:uncharacterized protein